MLKIKPTKIYHGTYKYVMRNNSLDNNYLFDTNKQVYRINNDLELIQVGKLNDQAMCEHMKLSFHPKLKQVAFILQDSSVAVGDFLGNLLWQQAGKFETVLFSNDGNFVWAIEKIDNNNLEINLFDSTNGKVICAYQLVDKLYDSIYSLLDIPNSNHITLELAAGQDGVIVYDLFYVDKINLQEMFPHNSFITPAWKDDHSKCFSLENDERIYAHFSYPDYKLISKEEYIEYENDEGQDMDPGYHMLYLENDLVITQNRNYRYFLINPKTMKRLDEIVFWGYEPVPVNQVYKRLTNDYSLYSQIIYFNRLGDIFVSSTNNRDEVNDLLLITKKDLLMQLELSNFNDD